MSDPNAPVVALRGISKSFGSLNALAGVDIDLHQGRIHALLGENGAGKTTLIRIVAGMLAPDAGRMLLNGGVTAFKDRREGLESGIGLVQQHLTQIAELTAAENYLLGAGSGTRNREAAADALAQAADDLGFGLDPNKLIRDLSLGDRQRLEVTMAVASDCQVLVLDEPTSLLGATYTKDFFEALHRLRDRGTSLVYVSHKLAEVVALADEATVLRAGEVVDYLEGQEITYRRLAEAMIGEQPNAHTKSMPPSGTKRVVALEGVCTESSESGRGLSDVDFTIRSGEVVGVAGLAGSGQVELAEILVGLRTPVQGSVFRDHTTSAYIPEDRHRDGIAEALSVVDNIVVGSHRSLLRRGVLTAGSKHSCAVAAIEGYRIPGEALAKPIATLSGGNQQRVVLARELLGDPELVVANNPYVGLDIASIADVRGRLFAAAKRGAAVVVCSPELEELFDLAARIEVMFSGAIVGSFQPDEASSAEIGQLMGGGIQ